MIRLTLVFIVCSLFIDYSRKVNTIEKKEEKEESDSECVCVYECGWWWILRETTYIAQEAQYTIKELWLRALRGARGSAELPSLLLIKNDFSNFDEKIDFFK